MSTADFLGGYTKEDEENDHDAEMGDESDEGEGVDLRDDSGEGDSSEEEDEDSEEERQVREGFIVDEDESSSRRRKKKRRKHKDDDSSRKRRKDDDEDDGDLDEDDLALLEENTGIKLSNRSSGHKLKRLRRRRSASEGSDRSDEEQGLNNIFDDDQPIEGNELFDADEMAGFIEDDTASESGRGSGSEDEDGERRRKSKKKQAKKTPSRRAGLGAGRIEGFTSEMWQEVQEVFGNGLDYEHAMNIDEDEDNDKQLKDVFEPSEIASRMLTEADDRIRESAIPERMQLASVGIPTLPPLADGSPSPYILEEDLDDARDWMASRISPRCNELFMMKDPYGNPPKLQDKFEAAVRKVIHFLNIDFLEVPFIWGHRGDFTAYCDEDETDPEKRNISLLREVEVWKISALSIKFRAFNNRKRELKTLFDSLEVEDDYFGELYDALDSIEGVSDLNEWLVMRYSKEIANAKANREGEEEMATTRLKRATRESRYSAAKANVVSRLAETIGISAIELSKDIMSGTKTHFAEDPDKEPPMLSEEFTSGEYATGEVALSAAKMILVHEISHDPNLRSMTRGFFKDYAVLTVNPTIKGRTKIDELHPFYPFKYLKEKQIQAVVASRLFLQILAAQAEDLVTIRVFLPDSARNKLFEDFRKGYVSDYASTVAEKWNAVRADILNDVLDNHLLPAGETWTKNFMQEEEEEAVARTCSLKLGQRINVQPYCRNDGSMAPGNVPSVLAISHGAGDPKRDSVIAVYLDSDGNLRDHFKFDNLNFNPTYGDDTQRETLVDLYRRRRPQVVVVGGFSHQAKNLHEQVTELGKLISVAIEQDDDFDEDEDLSPEQKTARARFDTIFVHDDVARLYMKSKRATVEFPDLSPVGRYAVGLARYAQSPLNEYAALGPDLTAISYDPSQKFLSKEKLTASLERTIMEVTNKVGVDINKAIRNSYYYNLLPYVAGLGPRKAAALVQKVNSELGGTLVRRDRLVRDEIVPITIFENCAAFLRIPQDDVLGDLKRDSGDVQPDILDDTRIHPEDYDVARKMAADAMEYDEEDIAVMNDKNPSQVVAEVMDSPEKLDDLSLDDFAKELEKILGEPKRLTLYAIRDEIQDPYGEARTDFTSPSIVELFTMLTGETPATLDNGLIIPVRVMRVSQENGIIVRLDCGIDGLIQPHYRSEMSNTPFPTPGQTIQALVIEMHPEAFKVDLSTQESAIHAGDFARRRRVPDVAFDNAQAERDRQEQELIQKKTTGRAGRNINHPNFHNFSAGQAEEYLAHQGIGDCVIRPSSKEDHLAVTWKVDEGVYQHIAVFEMNKVDQHSLGSPLKIGNKYSYTDLDELVFSHVKQMAKKVEELLQHDKCKGTQEALNLYLQNYTMANPGASAYGFGLNKKKPGQFVVSFRTDQHSEINSWDVNVLPGAYSLLGEDHGDVTTLCNAFKTAYANRSSAGNARLPARTPYGAGMGGGRTPGVPSRTPNPYQGRTPAQMASGRTPNPYLGRATPNPYQQQVARRRPEFRRVLRLTQERLPTRCNKAVAPRITHHQANKANNQEDTNKANGDQEKNCRCDDSTASIVERSIPGVVGDDWRGLLLGLIPVYSFALFGLGYLVFLCTPACRPRHSSLLSWSHSAEKASSTRRSSSPYNGVQLPPLSLDPISRRPRSFPSAYQDSWTMVPPPQVIWNGSTPTDIKQQSPPKQLTPPKRASPPKPLSDIAESTRS
ncbi:transcription elongation factor SPT6 [Pseudohyphozyma bogoriensis]|nr:transcription elongation factor SPT6 [Pseudohyphozyma bogoriensis]